MKTSEAVLAGFTGGLVSALFLVWFVVFILGRCIAGPGVVCI